MLTRNNPVVSLGTSLSGTFSRSLSHPTPTTPQTLWPSCQAVLGSQSPREATNLKASHYLRWQSVREPLENPELKWHCSHWDWWLFFMKSAFEMSPFLLLCHSLGLQLLLFAFFMLRRLFFICLFWWHPCFHVWSHNRKKSICWDSCYAMSTPCAVCILKGECLYAMVQLKIHLEERCLGSQESSPLWGAIDSPEFSLWGPACVITHYPASSYYWALHTDLTLRSEQKTQKFLTSKSLLTSERGMTVATMKVKFIQMVPGLQQLKLKFFNFMKLKRIYEGPERWLSG